MCYEAIDELRREHAHYRRGLELAEGMDEGPDRDHVTFYLGLEASRVRCEMRDLLWAEGRSPDEVLTPEERVTVIDEDAERLLARGDYGDIEDVDARVDRALEILGVWRAQHEIDQRKGKHPGV